jgi:hypothetical protein
VTRLSPQLGPEGYFSFFYFISFYYVGIEEDFVWEEEKIPGFFLQNYKPLLGFTCHVGLIGGTDRSGN